MAKFLAALVLFLPVCAWAQGAGHGCDLIKVSQANFKVGHEIKPLVQQQSNRSRRGRQRQHLSIHSYVPGCG